MRAKERAKRNTRAFTDLGIARLNVAKHFAQLNRGRREPLVQDLIWDEGCKGLSLLLGAGGSKTFRVTFKLDGKWITTALGRFGEIAIGDEHGTTDLQISEARRLTNEYRARAARGIDPRKAVAPAAAPAMKGDKLTFGYVVDRYIEDYAKRKQRTWDETQRILKNKCADWQERPIADISKQDVKDLLHSIEARGSMASAAVTYRWLKSFFRWAAEEDYVERPIVIKWETETTSRERIYSDSEIKAIWNAANKLPIEVASYIKLLVLLAPRKTSLALLEWSHLNDDMSVWTTPFALTKSRKGSKQRTYLTPLPPLAQRILRGMPKTTGLVFPSLPVYSMKSERRVLNDTRLRDALVRHGAPSDFAAHALRHTVATWLQNHGHSQWEVGLVLNHAGAGVTAGYSHGYPLELKRTLLTKWADHVESLVQPAGAALLQ